MKELIVPSQNNSQLNPVSKASIPGTQKIVLRPLVEEYASEALDILQSYTYKKLRVDDIILSRRLSATMGYASYNPVGRGYRYTLTISSKIFTRDCKSLRDTVYHEVAHLADWQIYKNWGHGATWERLMNRLGLKANVHAEPEEYLDAGYILNPKR